MATSWTTRRLASVALCMAAAACDRPPTAPHRAEAPVPSRPATPAGAQRLGNVILTGGYDADTTVRHTAARWAADGHPDLQAYVDTSPFWDGPRLPVTGRAPVFDTGPTAESFGTAVIMGSHTAASANGTTGIVTTTATYWGTDVHTDMRYSASRDDGTVVIPDQTHGFDDSNVPAKTACATQIFGQVQPLTACANWSGTAVHAATLGLGYACGVTVRGSGTYQAYFQLPIISPSVSSGGLSGALKWTRFGESQLHSDAVATAFNGTCPEVIKETPTCSQQIIYDPSSCDGDPASAIDDGQQSGTGGCQTYLVTIEQSYDQGRTWVIVASYITTIC